MDLALLLPCFMNLIFYLFVWFHFFCTVVSLVFYVSLNRLYFNFLTYILIWKIDILFLILLMVAFYFMTYIIQSGFF